MRYIILFGPCDETPSTRCTTLTYYNIVASGLTTIKYIVFDPLDSDMVSSGTSMAVMVQ